MVSRGHGREGEIANHALDPVIPGPLDPGSTHILSGAEIPRIDNPFRSTICAARASTRRAFMIGAGSLSTWCLWYQRWVSDAVSCKYDAMRCGSSASAAP